MSSQPRVPRLKKGVDFKTLPLTPSQGFVMTRIDGKVSEVEIARQTGLPAAAVQEAIDKLVELQAVVIGDDKAEKEAERKEQHAKAVAATAFGGALQPNATRLYTEAEVAEEVEIPEVKKRQILNAYAVLNKLSYYDLLGVHELVDKKEIKTAYYQVAPEFHPDKFFRKELGSFRKKVEAIFAKLTEAHDTLTRKKSRADYDEYLASATDLHNASTLFSTDQRQVAAAQAEIEREAQAAAGQQPHGAVTAEQQRALQARRATLAAKLRGGLSQPPPRRDSAPAPTPIDPRHAAEALRNRYEMAKADAQRRQVARYRSVGQQALAQKDWMAAANAYRIAASLAPDDEALQTETKEVLQMAASELADIFMRQAEAEANQERWEEASASFGKVCVGRPDDPKPHDRAAFATFKAGNNPRRAVEYARRAVELAPKQPVYRITLAYAYQASGFGTSAENELERALELAPDQKKIKGLVEQARESFKAPAPKPRSEPPASMPPQSFQSE